MKINKEDEIYPSKLRQIKNPPECLYCNGNIKLLKQPGIAIIGSRKCTEYGEKMAKKFAKELSLHGLTIISGMAEGTDSFAHIGCIEGSGNTIAVLPCGFNNIYPKQNTNLAVKIIEEGEAIVTEYPPGTRPLRENFPRRNRIMAGLSYGKIQRKDRRSD